MPICCWPSPNDHNRLTGWHSWSQTGNLVWYNIINGESSYMLIFIRNSAICIQDNFVSWDDVSDIHSHYLHSGLTFSEQNCFKAFGSLVETDYNLCPPRRQYNITITYNQFNINTKRMKCSKNTKIWAPLYTKPQKISSIACTQGKKDKTKVKYSYCPHCPRNQREMLAQGLPNDFPQEEELP